MKKVIYYSMSALLALLLFTCSPFDEQLDIEEEQTTEVVDIDALNVPDGFHYDTNKTVHLNIKMPKEIKFDDYRSRFSILTDTEENNGIQLVTGSFDTNGEYTDVFTVPTTLDKLYFKSVATDSLIPISSAYVEDEFVTIDLEEFYLDTLPETYYDRNMINSLLSEADGKQANTSITNGDFSINDFGISNRIMTNYPNDPRFYLKDSPLYHPLEWDEENGNGYLTNDTSVGKFYAFSQTIHVEGGEDLTLSVDYTKVVTGQNYGLWIWPRDVNGRPVDYSIAKTFNGNTSRNATLFGTIPEESRYVTIAVFGRVNKNREIRFDNVSLNGMSDTDNDGVEDDLDEFPDDPTRAFSYYFPSEEGYGTLAFEDTWPSRGDYDFNDMVVDYQYRQIMNADNKMVALEVEYKVKAAGAGYHNGIGFQMEVNPNMIASVTGTSLQSGYVTTNSNGTEAGQSKATIIMLDNVYNIMSYPGSGIGINTSPNAPYVQPQSVIATIEFTEPIDIDEAGYAPYNPFLIVNGERGKEVHLPGYPPTDLVDTSYFGTMNDDTNLALGKYYLTTANLPWGINLPQSFDYPAEGEEILGAYLRFGQWAQSSGFSFMDWYTNNSGYRDSGKIYSR